jgi:hypothetical protein
VASATAVVQAVCGPAAGGTVALGSPPTSGFCNKGTFANDNFSYSNPGNGYSWNCLGSDVAHSVFCADTIIPTAYTLTVNKTIGGTVSSIVPDNAIDCGSVCQKNYSKNTVVILHALPDSLFWKFVGWTGDCTGNGDCTVTVDGSKIMSAIFAPRPFQYQEF